MTASVGPSSPAPTALRRLRRAATRSARSRTSTSSRRWTTTGSCCATPSRPHERAAVPGREVLDAPHGHAVRARQPGELYMISRAPAAGTATCSSVIPSWWPRTTARTSSRRGPHARSTGWCSTRRPVSSTSRPPRPLRDAERQARLERGKPYDEFVAGVGDRPAARGRAVLRLVERPPACCTSAPSRPPAPRTRSRRCSCPTRRTCGSRQLEAKLAELQA